MYKYRNFIRKNVAPPGTKRIIVHDGSGKQVCSIPTGPLTPPAGNPLYRVGLGSDLHLWKTGLSWSPDIKFDAALTSCESEGCVFFAHAGDITQTGFFYEGDAETFRPEQFQSYKDVCDKHSIPVYGVCGNHESYTRPITENLDDLVEYTGNPLYYTVEQAGDLYVFVGQPTSNEVMGLDALRWLQQTLEDNRNRRCFVFLHPYIEEDSGDPLDFRENSIFDYWGAAKTTAFMGIMRHYRNAVLFHGHSHTKLEYQTLDVTANYTERNGFKSVHIPSLSRPRDLDVESGTTPEDLAGSEGYIMDVYAECIVLRGFDFAGSKPIPLGTYRIDTQLVDIPAGTFSDPTGTINTEVTV